MKSQQTTSLQKQTPINKCDSPSDRQKTTFTDGKNILKKINSKWFLLFLFTFFSLSIQAKYDEGSSNNDGMEDIIDDHTSDDYAPLDEVAPEGFDDSQYILEDIDICTNCDNNDIPDSFMGFPEDDSDFPDSEPIDFPEYDPDTNTNPTPDPDPEKTWYLDYDGDGYHSETYSSINSPGDKWSLSTKGSDCDDARKQYTTVCCTKTCESGYKLNVNTCECELLPPCWGTIKDYETSNAFNSSSILNELNSVLGDFGISTDVMDMLNESNIFDPKVIAQSTDIATHANAIGNIGDASQVIMSYFEYIDEPSTQNLLKFALDTVSPFLSPAASLALSTIDFYKDSNGDSKLDLLLRAAGDYIDRQSDCNLGLGVRNAIF